MRNILDINFRTKINGVSSASTDYNTVELSIVPNETQKTNFKIEVTDYASILHTSNVVSLIDGRISYTIPFDYWKGIGTIKVRLLSSEGNSTYLTLANKVNLNGSEQVIVKYGESSFEISVVEKSSASSLIDLFLPVGHVITNGLASFDPNVLYAGTTWIRRKGRVIVGVDESQTEFATVDKIGGHKNLQTHSHGVSVGSGGEHGHSASSGSAGGHNHSASTSISSASITGQCRVLAHPAWVGGNSGSLGIYDPSSREPYPSGNASAMAAYLKLNNSHGHGASTSIGWGGDHAHSISVGNGGSHGHSATISNTGTGNAENLQPYITKYVWERIS
ncbi:phage baseplate protein [Amedibacillus sp. YH-ame6]